MEIIYGFNENFWKLLQIVIRNIFWRERRYILVKELFSDTLHRFLSCYKIMHNQPPSNFPSSSQASSDIVKAIRKGFVAAPPPIYKGEQIIRRTETNLARKRHADNWKDQFHRRETQKAKGFFSLMAQPYEELGHTELDTKKLVLKSLSDLGRIHDCKVNIVVLVSCQFTTS